MYAETPRRLILAGDLGAAEIVSLTEYCARLHGSGQAEVHLDVSAMTRCHRPGLDGLLALLAGAGRLRVTVGGAHWSQFLELLSETPIDEIQDLRASVRGVIEPAGTA